MWVPMAGMFEVERRGRKEYFMKTLLLGLFYAS